MTATLEAPQQPSPLESAPAVLNSLKAAGKPVVLVDRKFPGEYTSWIGPDNEAIVTWSGQGSTSAVIYDG